MVAGICLLLFNACKDNMSVDLEDSLRVFSELNPIEDASSTNMTVNKGNRVDGTGYFQVEIEGVGANALLKNGVHEAWCLEWRKPMRSSNDVHRDVKWYSSIGNSKWRPLNYFFSIRNELKLADPALNTMEIQSVVWSLTGYMGIGPEFNILTLENSQLPSDWFDGGTPKFSKEKVHAIVSRVLSEYKSPQFKTSGNPGTAMMSVSEGGCIVGETDPDQQNVCIPVDPDPDAEIVFASITAGSDHSCVLDVDGQAYCWGQNSYAQLGDGTTIDKLTPVAVSMPNGVSFKSISAGYNHTLALSSDGQAWAWGFNENGQLGDGTLSSIFVPVQVMMPAGVNFTTVRAGGSFSIALSEDGRSWSWGSNFVGQLGNGSTIDELIPVQVSKPTDLHFKSISAGDAHTLALSIDGKIWAWGSNWAGQLGDGTNIDRLTPLELAMPDGVNFSSVKAGGPHSLALSLDGKAWGWGSNVLGQLGDGTTINRLFPVAVLMPTGVSFSSIAAGNTHSIALSPDGKAWAWGNNWFGQLGDGTSVGKFTPSPVSMPSSVSFHTIAADAVSGHSLALSTDGQVWSWGWNTWGQLGDGTTDDRSIPVALLWP